MENNIILGLKEDASLTQQDAYLFYSKIRHLFQPKKVILEARCEKRDIEEAINDHSFCIELNEDQEFSKHLFFLYEDLNDYILRFDDDYVFMVAVLSDTKFLGMKKISSPLTPEEENRFLQASKEVLKDRTFDVKHLKEI